MSEAYDRGTQRRTTGGDARSQPRSHRTSHPRSQPSSKPAEKPAAGRRRRRKKGGSSTLSNEHIETKTNEAMAQIEVKTLVEGCVFNSANILQEQSNEPIFTTDDIQAGIARCKKRSDCIFRTCPYVGNSKAGCNKMFALCGCQADG